MRLAQLPSELRPRERLLSSGAEALSDAELLAILLRTGSSGCSVLDLAQQLLAEFGDLHSLARARPTELSQIALGMGQAKAATLVAAFELGRRSARGRGSALVNLEGWCTAWAFRLKDEEREFIVAGFFDEAKTLLADERISYGGFDGAALDMAHLLRRAVRLDCRYVALLHNHPDGAWTPSSEDRRLTVAAARRLELLNVGFLGHFLVVDGRHRPVPGA